MNPPGAAAHDGARARALMSIGEVLALLRADFPDTTISMLRFLESEGLVEPQRTAAGYRKYSWDDVARLRFVLAAQRDHYLPLRVIREQLREDPPGEPGPDAASRPALVAVGAAGPEDGAEPDPPEVRLTRAELLARAGIDQAMLDDLEQHGLVRPRASGWYDGDTLIIARISAQLAGHGLEPRHLRAYRLAADREVGNFAALVAPLARQNDPAARTRAQETLRELSVLSLRLHAALVRAGLRDTLGG